MSDGLDLILNGLEPDKAQTLDEELLLKMIADRVNELLAQEPDLLFSYMYRLDIDQDKIEKALIPDQDAVEVQLARLILKRQKERIATKAKYKVKPIEGWEF